MKKAMRNLKQTSLFPLHTPGLLPLLFFFPLLITVMLLPKSAVESAQKTFPGPGVVAARQMPLRPVKMLSQAGAENTRDLGSPLCSLQPQDPPDR